jgi:hypothetical protein
MSKTNEINFIKHSLHKPNVTGNDIQEIIPFELYLCGRYIYVKTKLTESKLPPRWAT